MTWLRINQTNYPRIENYYPTRPTISILNCLVLLCAVTIMMQYNASLIKLALIRMSIVGVGILKTAWQCRIYVFFCSCGTIGIGFDR